jgi:sugar phosphate isomerase/epimerase
MSARRMTRREWLAWSGAFVAAGAVGSLRASEGQKVARIGVQLYTLRSLMSTDVPGTLAAVAEAGFAEVETAGLAGLTPTRFGAALKDAGLQAPSAHVPLDAIESNPDELLELAEVLGHDYLVLPWLTEQQRSSLDQFRHIADVLNAFGEQCAGAGVQLAYHNHDFEFVAIDGRQPFDLLLERCDPELVKFEMDLFWAATAGVDASAYFRASPGRYPLCHVKDRTAAGEMVAVGDGDIDFVDHFRAGVTGGLQHYFVEHDNPADPLASISRSIATVRSIRF